MEQIYKYYAFISYNSKDTDWGKKLQKKLEGYKMSTTLCNQHGWNRRPIKPVFFAPTDIQPGGLTEELQDRLRASKNLIVICSPNSAKSDWVGKEIDFFHKFGRTKQIHFFIVDGIPHSGNPETECFNPIVNTLGLPEILGANIHEKIYRLPWINKERAYVQIISKLLGVEFDEIWQRHKRLLVEQCIMWLIGIIAIISALIGVWLNNQPVDIDIQLNENSIQNTNLPPIKDAIVTITLDKEIKVDTIKNTTVSAFFSNIPHKLLGKQIKVQVSCRDFIPVDTIITLAKINKINMTRNHNVYGDIHFRLWNPNTERPVNNAVIEIENFRVRTNDKGFIKLMIPLNKQRQVYKISSSIPLETDSIYMPCGDDDIIIIK